MAWNKKKEYPRNYSPIIVDVLDALSITGNPHIVGSASLRSIQFAGDYDAMEYVPHLSAKQIQSVIKKLLSMKNVIIGDIKAGSDDSKRVLSPDVMIEGNKVINYNQEESLARLGNQKGKQLLKKRLTPKQYLEAKEFFKNHILRWTPEQILKGEKDGIELEDAIKTSGITKIDTVVRDGERYVEVSCIYNTAYTAPVDAEQRLKEDVLAYAMEGNYFKAFKRVFSIARTEGDKETALKLIGIFNGDYGRLYSVISDIQMIQYILDNASSIPKENISEELEGFRARLANIWTLASFIKREPSFDRAINKIAQSPLRARKTLDKLVNQLNTILQKEAKKAFSSLGLIPIPKKYLP